MQSLWNSLYSEGGMFMCLHVTHVQSSPFPSICIYGMYHSDMYMAVISTMIKNKFKLFYVFKNVTAIVILLMHFLS